MSTPEGTPPRRTSTPEGAPARVRTRFAPSPTGFLHLGNARTALFNWAFARHHGGELVLRIEDTDKERSTREAEENLLSVLEWLGLDWDEGPLRQSDRAARHAEAIEQLLASEHAYRCTCTREDLEERKQATIAAGGKWTYDGRCREARHGPDCGPHTVRLRLAEKGRLEWHDAVFGPSGQDVAEVGDRIVRRSDGGVLYHLAVVVDDHDMGITHVIRGADHHINTPLQLALARALGFEPPHYAHVPLIVGPGGKKLSKRRDDASIETHREQGFLSEALANWLVRMGWSHGDQEVFSLEEIRSLFDLDAVGRNPAGADRDKLLHLNQLWLRALSAGARFERAHPHLERAAGGPVERTAQLDQLLERVAERSQTLPDLAERARFALVDEIAVDEKAMAKHWKPAVLEPLAALHARLEAAPAWNEREIEAAFEQVCEAADMKLGKLAQPVRVAVTGTAASPGIFETLAILGRERTLARIGVALAHLRAA